MKIKQVGPADKAKLLILMRESFEKEIDSSPEEWNRTKAAVEALLLDARAGEACLAFDDSGNEVGYIVMCRGFSLDYGGYFTWVEESYMRQSDQGRFRDQRFSP